MLLCWKADPKERMTFAELVTTIESILTKVAQYLDFNDFFLTVDIKSEENSKEELK